MNLHVISSERNKAPRDYPRRLDANECYPIDVDPDLFRLEEKQRELMERLELKDWNSESEEKKYKKRLLESLKEIEIYKRRLERSGSPYRNGGAVKKLVYWQKCYTF